MMEKPLLLMKQINKDFSGVQVLYDVDFEMSAGEVMALMGENGAGKSTLMKILAGVHTDWQGSILIEGEKHRFKNTKDAEQAGISIIYQELNLVQELSVAENIFLGREPAAFGGMINYPKMNRMAHEITDELNLNVDVRTPIAQLRVGQQQLVEIAKALSLNARILIMDEPSSALSDTETEILFRVIRQLIRRNVAVIYISHRMGEVFEIADRVTVLRDGHLVGVRSAKEVQRQELISMMVGRDFDQFFVKESAPQDEVALEVNRLTRKTIDGKYLIKDVTFRVRKGEQFGIAGLLGAGRTELLEAIFGADFLQTSGEVKINGQHIDYSSPEKTILAGLSLITEDRKGNGLVLGMSVEQNMTLAALREIVRYGMLSKSREKSVTGRFTHRLSINVSDMKNPIETLSGGNQQKVLLAKWLLTNPRILLLDEPTRGIDVGAKHEIYELLSELSKQGITIIIVSSELTELLSICDRIMVMREGTVSAILEHEEASQEKIMDAAAPLA
ncbi:ATP-binding cassette domain-containing protein [candidate division KSB1 bacterium]|nr:ATP-binding cassette domain-containing protein [candidate division KSB1 bacterium]